MARARSHDRTRTIGTFDKKFANDGWLNFPEIVRELEKTIPLKNFSPNETIREILGKLKIPPRRAFAIIFPRKRYVIIRFVKAASKRRIKNQKNCTDILIKKNGSGWKIVGGRKSPPRPQRNRRRITRRQRERLRRLRRRAPRNRRRLTMDQVILSDHSELSQNLALSETSLLNLTASGMFLESTSKEQAENIAENPGANPLNNAGIYTNRPTVLINSTYVPLPAQSSARERFKSSILYNLTKQQVVKEYFLELSDQFPEKFEEMTQLYTDWEFQMGETLKFVSEIDDFKSAFLGSFDNYSETGVDIEGYGEDLNPTQAILQSFADIGRSAFHGTRYFYKKRKPNLHRNISSSGNTRGNYPLNKSKHGLVNAPRAGQTDFKYRRKFSSYNQSTPIDTIVNGSCGAEFSTLIQGFSSKISYHKSYRMVFAAQYVWTELINSYIYSSGDSATKEKWDSFKGSTNILRDLVGDSFDVGLLPADNSVGLAKFLRFPFKGETIMPFEKPGLGFDTSNKKLASAKTGIDSWIDPNIGKVFEGEDPDYSGLDAWSEEFSGFVESTKQRIAPFITDGHGQLIFNEFIRGLIRVGLQAEQSHPNESGNTLDDSLSGFEFSDDWVFSTPAGDINLGEDDLEMPRKLLALLHPLKKSRYHSNPTAFWSLVYQSMCNYEVNANGTNSQDINFVNAISSLEDGTLFQKDGFGAPAGRCEHKARRTKKHILNLFNKFITDVEKAVCYDVAMCAAEYGLAPPPGPEDTEAESVWSKIFSGAEASTYPIDTAVPDFTSSDANVHISTAYNGINHIIIRALLTYLMCELSTIILSGITTDLVVGSDGSTGKIKPEANYTNALRSRLGALFFTVVDNINPEDGPVRWKLTYGDWPSDDIELEIQAGVYEQIIPVWARDFSETGDFNWEDYASGMIWFRRKFNVGVRNVGSLMANQYKFLVEKENFVPLTYVANQEIPEVNATAEEVMERGSLRWPIKYCQYHREGTRRLYKYLDFVTSKYLGVKDEISLLSEDSKAEAMKAIAQLPGIDVIELSRYSGFRQTNLRQFIKSDEKALAQTGYIPANNFVSNTMAKNLPAYLETHTDLVSKKSISGKPQEGRIFSIGIPYGLIDSQKAMSTEAKTKEPNQRLISINQSTMMIFVGQYAVPIKRVYWPSLFIKSFDFASLPEGTSLDNAIQALKYNVFDWESGTFVQKNYSTVHQDLTEILQVSAATESTPEDIIKNHFVDFILKSYLKHYSGINVEESSFSVSKDSNKLYLDAYAVENLDDLFTNLGLEDLSVVFDDINIKQFKDFQDSILGDPDDNFSKYSDIVAITQSRLVSKEQMATKVFVPNIFDRVFSFYTHVAEYEYTLSKRNYAPPYIRNFLDLQPNGNYAINLTENPKGNFLLNDNVTQSLITVEVL